MQAGSRFQGACGWQHYLVNALGAGVLGTGRPLLLLRARFFWRLAVSEAIARYPMFYAPIMEKHIAYKNNQEGR